MRLQAILILLIIVFGIIVPPSFPGAACQSARAEWGVLDVCHSAVPALSAHGDMPCINACLYQGLPYSQVARADTEIIASAPILLASRTEHPPQV